MAANRMRISLSFEAESDWTQAEAEQFYASTAEWLRSATGIAWRLEVTVLVDRDGRAHWTPEDFERFLIPPPDPTEGQ